MEPQPELQQLREDVDLVARHVAKLPGERDARIDGLRSDFEVALLELAGRIERRFQRLEAVIAESVVGEAPDLTRDLLSKH